MSERRVVVSDQEMQDILFAIRSVVGSPAVVVNFPTKRRMVQLYDRFEYLVQHDEQGIPIGEAKEEGRTYE